MLTQNTVPGDFSEMPDKYEYYICPGKEYTGRANVRLFVEFKSEL